MKYIKHSQVVQVDNSPTNHVAEYPHNDPEINLAVIECSKRYPDKDFVINQKSKELVYVQSGNITLIQPGMSTKLTQGDSVIIDQGEPFAWEGSAILITVCTPPWSQDQHINHPLP